MKLPEQVHVISHPLVQRKLTLARDIRSTSDIFRRLLGEIAMLMAYELTREYPVDPVEVRTPLAVATGADLRRGITLVPILRAGLGMADGILQLVPQARVGYLGIYRDETTLEPVVYYNKLPPGIAETDVIVIDPMLATGGSCTAAIDVIKQTGAKSIKLLCLVAAPEGIRKLVKAHPDVMVYTAAVDSHLNENGYIVPGLGDAGDRLFGTQ
ncbi:MAG TPA: uracil phosphoribosyltransferase [Phycisphaerae bacterium]|nr:uracil phosphoribosyltransferase [Phycisphaerae bacterium]HOJ75625.1 uracil phosphoribosyltransferase [Phycisphaerae bacterium]HOM52493.1 uracil phosphoribosyltransferase [Phycisphaerae bacterium]HON65364.1 uracil phosphoribosyltransferase [Phycisphaerae bacterium]HOQ85335.1 uracil phosphoribosyltransferase [Phycisphaerae bacterium]